MKIEYVPPGSPDCPLILIYGAEVAPVRTLFETIEALSSSKLKEVSLASLDGFESVNGCQLILRGGRDDDGVRQIRNNQFEWVQTPFYWIMIGDLVEPFMTPSETASHQWLTGKESSVPSRSDVGVVISNQERGGW
jgi:hypothetical protein